MTPQQFLLGIELLLVIKKHNLPLDQTTSVVFDILEKGFELLEKENKETSLKE